MGKKSHNTDALIKILEHGVTDITGMCGVESHRITYRW